MPKKIVRLVIGLAALFIMPLLGSAFLGFVGLPDFLQIPMMAWLGWMTGTEFRKWLDRDEE